MMTLSELKRAVDRLSREQREELAAYIAALAKIDDPAYVAETSKRADDRDPARWVSLDEVEARIRQLESEGR